ncbi:hypothetical protein SODALDRAFT_127932 [Sodiomyces alkalinus F11]|uniref:Uncharacterized protein n=1 Tax=Sodiomyces alkalinus (strain CBS 110278 / VKM F-3762 / F11) TaxID=1314773 RepID=A0A3N2Q4P3_SODAK|nr:hypothetical protein SODALDRAFT_127932 [Sodiomyces alkalinus F11]ROT41731.1 hypothetical protein SODALDRAFT_127932 [Sodiomyces alkalinus F11]
MSFSNRSDILCGAAVMFVTTFRPGQGSIVGNQAMVELDDGGIRRGNLPVDAETCSAGGGGGGRQKLRQSA